MYSSGVHISPNPTEAFKLMQSAAINGLVVAQTELGEFYSKGVGTTKNSSMAFEWLNKASENDDGRAHYLLAQAYFRGDGTQKDSNMALLKAQKALSLGISEASFLVEVLSSSTDIKSDPVFDEGKEIEFGNYYALIIGNDNYQNVDKLNTGAVDAKAVNEILKTKFNFKTELLINQSRTQILDTLYSYRTKLTESDNLLIFYSGHGEKDKKTNRGHWLPVDADPEKKYTWISNSAILDAIEASDAKHILLVIDSCFSGIFAEKRLREKEGVKSIQRELLEQKSQLKSRWVMTAGGDEPVFDAAQGENSIFVKHFLLALTKVSQPITAMQLFDQSIKNSVELNSNQVPTYTQIQHVDSRGGEFIFVRAKN